jgi:ComF family protein
VCHTCRGRSFAFEFALAPYEARGVMRDLIHRFKYQRQLHLRPLLGELLAQLRDHPRLRPWIENGLTVPVPLHPRRFREREFNQAEELCQELKRRWGIPSTRALKRLRYTSTQTRFRRGQRQANLHGAFALSRDAPPKWEERPLLLVDDVFTTGSTAHECARVLRDAGAKNVVVITLARG